MKTTIKSLKLERYENNNTGRVIVRISDNIAGYVRNVDADGVITFAKADVDVLRMNLSAFLAQVRNAVDEKFITAFGYRLDTAKVSGVDAIITDLNVLLSGATIEVEAEVQATTEGEDGSHESIFYKIGLVKFVDFAEYLIAQNFVENFMKVSDITRQQIFIAKLFGIKL